MFNWFKSKSANHKDQEPSKQPQASLEKPETRPKSRRESLIEEAQQNARAAREAIGPERLDRMKDLIEAKMGDHPEKKPVIKDRTSPADQARKIIQKMDIDKLSDQLRYLRNEPPTKH